MSGSARLDPDLAQLAIEYCYEQDWSDGLPLVPVSQPLLDRFLAQTGRGPQEVLGALEQTGRECTIELAAINAAMAGCRPEYFPVVLAAFEALMLDRAARGGGWQSTSGPAPLIVVNGPVRGRLGFNGAGGVFGPGFRPNATVARSVGLIVRNAFGIRPQVLEQATQGIPGRWSICIAENEEESPWEPLAAEAGHPAGTSAVSATLLRTCEFVDNRHTQDPEQVLWDFADTISRTGALIFKDTSCGVVFCPEHAQLLAAAGFAKDDVKDWLIEHCGRTGADLRRAGKDGVSENNVRFAAGTAAMKGDGEAGGGFSRILPSRQHVPVMVAGARNAAISMVVRVFGLWSGASVPVETRHDPAAAAAAAGPPAPPGAGDSGHPASDRPADAGPGGYPSGPGPGPAEAEAG
jgi:hypothetical protein